MEIKRIAPTLHPGALLINGLVITSWIARSKGKNSAPSAAANQCTKEAELKKRYKCNRAANEAIKDYKNPRRK